MATTIRMPALSPTMEHGKLARWLVKEGERVAPGDVIAEIETDKATMEVESDDGGVVARLLVPEGAQNVPVGAPMAVIAEEGEDIDEAALEKAAAEAPAAATHGTAQTGAPAPAAPEPAQQAEPAPQLAAPQVAVSTAPGDGGPDPARNLSITPPPVNDPLFGDDVVFKETSVREALRDAMAEEMRRDEAVFLMGEEVAQYQGAYKVSQGLLEEFGERRVVDTPITEYGFTGLGVGAAFAGLKPVIEFMTFNFAMQAIDHIINSAAKTLYMSGGSLAVPVVFRGPNGAASRVAAQHSQDYSAWFAHVPGLKVIAPHSAADAKGLLKAAIRDPGPVVFLENELLYGHRFPVPQVEDYVLPIGRARIARVGTDVTIAAYSMGMEHALDAARMLAEEGISAEVIDLRSLRPLDVPAIVESVKKTNRLVTVEEGWPVCSIGAEIARRVMQEAFDWLDAPVLTVTGRDVPMPYAANLEKLALPTAQDVVDAAHSVLYR